MADKAGIGTLATGGGLSLAGGLIDGLTGASALRKQNRILGEGIRQQSRFGQEGASAVADWMAKMRGLRANIPATTGMYSGAIGGGSVGVPITGSRVAAQDARGATQAAQGYGGNLAELFARIQAPQDVAMAQQDATAGLSRMLAPINMRSSNADYITNLRAGMTQANPWTSMLGQSLSGAGKAAIGKWARDNAGP